MLFIYLSCRLLIRLGLGLHALDIAGRIYRTGWPGSFHTGLDISRRVVNCRQAYRAVFGAALEAIAPHASTAKYFADPSEMLNMNVLVLKSPNSNERGVLVIKYSQYFGLFAKLFDVDTIAEHYTIVLEPSWAGYCDSTLLSYGALKYPTFVMAYEPRDLQLLQELDGQLKPLAIGPS